jgi:hypothetical protein
LHSKAVQAGGGWAADFRLPLPLERPGKASSDRRFKAELDRHCCVSQ